MRKHSIFSGGRLKWIRFGVGVGVGRRYHTMYRCRRVCVQAHNVILQYIVKEEMHLSDPAAKCQTCYIVWTWYVDPVPFFCVFFGFSHLKVPKRRTDGNGQIKGGAGNATASLGGNTWTRRRESLQRCSHWWPPFFGWTRFFGRESSSDAALPRAFSSFVCRLPVK